MRRRYGRGPAAAVAAVAVAALLCGLAGWSYARAAGDETRAYAEARDSALDAGRRHVARLSSVDAGLPGTASARATVTDAALTALDVRAGTAELIATVRVETTPGDGRPAGTDRKRLEADLTRTGDGWKVTALTAVPVAGP
ncbi:hypothetical protein AMK26_34065 [Streptomyces sp. CB03234]|uniref:hypothetical protein n=1 Tax=Streptomyces sp. (strain CB03234) TaxID=1703937 RepID=UPI00093AF489|nr:hypothetical protein [Streptomyces sp. CB03234]OKJ93515.1 hypothetical protein AMK26_34065 [Streptomyces sp. CB03234]